MHRGRTTRARQHTSAELFGPRKKCASLWCELFYGNQRQGPPSSWSLAILEISDSGCQLRVEGEVKRGSLEIISSSPQLDPLIQLGSSGTRVSLKPSVQDVPSMRHQCSVLGQQKRGVWKTPKLGPKVTGCRARVKRRPEGPQHISKPEIKPCVQPLSLDADRLSATFEL
ncbi:hypothetical protein MHYP_G00211330 [Metynnis hypsauchen]